MSCNAMSKHDASIPTLTCRENPGYILFICYLLFILGLFEATNYKLQTSFFTHFATTAPLKSIVLTFRVSMTVGVAYAFALFIGRLSLLIVMVF